VQHLRLAELLDQQIRERRAAGARSADAEEPQHGALDGDGAVPVDERLHSASGLLGQLTRAHDLPRLDEELRQVSSVKNRRLPYPLPAGKARFSPRRRDYGTLRVPFPKVIKSAAAGAVGIGGTLVVEICADTLARGVVCTNWLGGRAAPFLSRAYIRSRAWIT